MRAFQISDARKVPELVHIMEPDLTAGQLKIEINACGLNFADILTQNGTYQDIPVKPFTMGMELAGIVLEVCDSVTEFKTGDRVAVFSGQGGLAEYGVFDANRAVHRACLRMGETLLVTGASGGVGLAAVEIGKLMGARVIAHARGSEKLAVAKAAGADHLIDDAEDLRAQLKELGGVDVVFDAVGGDVFKAAFRSCLPEGRILAIGFASGDVPQIPANHLLVKNLSVIGFNIGAYLSFRPEVVRDSLSTLFDWFCAGAIEPHISHVLPLERAAEGLELLRTRTATGKVVITP